MRISSTNWQQSTNAVYAMSFFINQCNSLPVYIFIVVGVFQIGSKNNKIALIAAKK